MSSIMIRVTPGDHDGWFKAHSACEEAGREYGMSDGPLYRDAVDPTVTLVTLEVQELDRAMGWFADERFQRAAQAAGPATREMWIAERRG